jgi:dinuclear metal center YbgI/SA1388 family protein
MPDIRSINKFLKELLDPRDIQDTALNGIQVENDRKNIDKIAFAVDISNSAVKMAAEKKCDLLITHHGFFWGKPLPVSGTFKKTLRSLFENNIGLISYHLPLDMHPVLGNNAQVLKCAGIGPKNIKPFGFYKGTAVGYFGNLKNEKNINEICKGLGLIFPNNGIKYLDFGNKKIKSIAVVSGSGAGYFQEAIEKNIDLYITGDREHILYHPAEENKLNVLFAGHYFTETFGLKALRKEIEKAFGAETFFLDIPTGL